MARRQFDVQVTTTMPPDVTGTVTAAEFRVLSQYRDVILRAFREAWTGWKYAGRPPDAPRLVSFDAWTATVDTQGHRPVLVISNNARGYASGRDYVAQVRRKKGARPEWELVFEDVERSLVPKLAAELAKAIGESIGRPGPPRPVRTTGGDTVVLELSI
jgi:hypothetical protein